MRVLQYMKIQGHTHLCLYTLRFTYLGSYDCVIDVLSVIVSPF